MSSTNECPNCHRQIRATSKFCKYCGQSLKVCPECQELNNYDAAFCALCGTDISKIEAAEPVKGVERIEEIGVPKQQKVVMWPPMPSVGQIQPKPQMQVFEEGTPYQPTSIKYPYRKVRPLGFLVGPLPTSTVFGAVIEALGYALALIAAGVAILGIGLTFFEFIVLPIMAGVFGGALLLSAPFFGIYYVSSNWLYKTFQIKRPVKSITIVGNYALGTLLFAIVGFMLAPVFIVGDALWISIAVLGGIIYLMGLIIIPLKAFLADLVYVKAAMKLRDEGKDAQIENEENIEKKQSKSEDSENDKKVKS